jgi:hypothetical protein
VTSSNGSKVENRPLTVEEKTLLEWLMEQGSPEAREFTPQLEHARVVGRCGCGCPTIDLGIGASDTRTVGASQILAEFVGTSPEGWQVGVLLHARDGKLSELEIYNLSEHEGAYSLPSISTLTPF